MNQLWSWVLTAIGVTGLLIAGRLNKAGWAIGLAAQTLWLTYAIVTHQWGFIVSAFAYGSVYARNWWRWNAAETAATKAASRAGQAEGEAT